MFMRFCLLLLTLATAVPSGAQDTTRAELDSLTERLRRAEQAIELLRQQMAADAESKVQAASRVKVDLFGRVLMNAFTNSARVNSAEVPLFALRADSSGADGMSAAVRQTTFGLVVNVGDILGGTFSGELHTDFFGGQQPSSGGRHFPLLRVRRAFGTLTWSRGELLFGQDNPLVAGVSPRSVASVGTPEFTGAGNLWLWLPQIRGTVELVPQAGIGLQAAVLAPTSGEPADPFDTGFDGAERSGRPYLQARLRARLGEGGRAGEVGVGVHRGWIRRADLSLASSEALVADALIHLGDALELRGEVYGGKAVRGLGGGGAGQQFTATGSEVEDKGGWGQLTLRPSTLVAFSGGCGVSDPRDDADLPADRLRNVTCALEAVATPGGGLVFALGWRTQRTTYDIGLRRNHHLNLGFGFEF
jgi:hypothetical protein